MWVEELGGEKYFYFYIKIEFQFFIPIKFVYVHCTSKTYKIKEYYIKYIKLNKNLCNFEKF